jgi:hypothetical protein
MLIKLNKAQIRKLADIFADIGQVSFASIALPFFLENYRPIVSVTGLILACGAWLGSLYLSKRLK